MTSTTGRWAALGLLLALVVSTLGASPSTSQSAPARRHLLIVVDGLRPDYVTPEVMPTLTALGKRGVVFTRHHSVYPTVTRVNASSISTGAYPERHGLMGNTVFFPKVDATKFLDTADRDTLMKIAQVEGRLLTSPTLGESLQAAGRRMLVVSSGSSGSALLNSHTVAGGAILHRQFTMPAALGEAMTAIGPAPEDAPAGALDRHAVDAFLKVGLPRIDPTVTVLWLSDLDSTAHDHGIGDPATVAVLRHVDGEIKRIEDALRAAGLFEHSNIWVTSDHGFSTYTGAVDLNSLLKPFMRALPDGSPRIVAGGGAIYVRDHDDAAIRGIVTALQQSPRVGPIFTASAKAGSLDGRIAGTLSFDSVRWTHDRSAQILFSPEWTDAANRQGMKGTSASNGTAGHGSASPWDVHNTLIAAGPDLKQGVTLDTPSANADFMPTFLTLLGLPIPASVQGRPLAEAFANRSGLPAPSVRTTEHTASTADHSYSVTATHSTVTVQGRDYRYFDSAKVAR